jgi:hypothetical protein
MNRWLVSACVLGLVVACGQKTGTSTSNVDGQLQSGTFPSAPTAVDAVDETGAHTRTPVAADGSFHLSLTKGHTYRLAIVMAAGSEPLVFPRSASKLDTTVRISSGAARVALGAVHHVASAPATGFQLRSAGAPSTGAPCDGECVDDQSGATCDDGNQGQDNQADGECVDGKDAKTGAACTDEADSADPTQPMAIPEHDAPDDVGGCNDGADDEGETNDD